VRFGNVLGSRGSVIPTLERQIALGGPITITHPDATRYYLSIGEAVSLVIQAAALTGGGDSYILDMGVPIKTTDLAHRLIRMRGLRPGRDIEIKYIGLRPGEKMSEELVAPGEETIPTEHPSVLRIHRLRPLDLTRLDVYLDELVSSAQDGMMPDAVRGRLARIVAELQAGSPPSAPVMIPAAELTETRAIL
jgi:FlaA1/EpsC-like NDP-sugar epimerase